MKKTRATKRLIATGVNKQLEELAGTGVTLIANQFYLPIKPDIQ